jgi:hypothetical protein
LTPSPMKKIHRLDADLEASGPHDFTRPLQAPIAGALHVHRIPPRVRDDRASAPLWNGTAKDMRLIWVFCKSEYFYARGLTANR